MIWLVIFDNNFETRIINAYKICENAIDTALKMNGYSILGPYHVKGIKIED